MSGPLRTEDVAVPADEIAGSAPDGPVLEIIPSRETRIDGLRVLRALPARGRRTVGAWCFADHMTPPAPGGPSIAIGPHPHIGLQTVTWLVSGEVLHRDSIGSEQLIRPGQLNLMTAGRGVVHSEETPASAPGVPHGIQLWVAQPEATRHGEPAFEHHPQLPRLEIDGASVTVLVGDLAGVRSPARRDTEHMGADIELQRGRASVPLRPEFEHALVVLSGSVGIGGVTVEPGALAYLGCRRNELSFTARAAARVVLLGGLPFESPVFMWWNFVARTRDEVDAARRDWEANSSRFGLVRSQLARIPAPLPPWVTKPVS